MSEKKSERDQATTRRHFCQATGIAACTVAAGGAAALSVDFLKPRALFEPPTKFDAGPADAIGVGDVITNEMFRAYVVRRQDGFHSMSSVCTHLGCITRYLPSDGIIACPCHGSRYNLDGEVLAGPAPRPLHWLEMDLSPKGDIEVDTSLEVPFGTVFKL